MTTTQMERLYRQLRSALSSMDNQSLEMLLKSLVETLEETKKRLDKLEGEEIDLESEYRAKVDALEERLNDFRSGITVDLENLRRQFAHVCTSTDCGHIPGSVAIFCQDVLCILETLRDRLDALGGKRND